MIFNSFHFIAKFCSRNNFSTSKIKIQQRQKQQTKNTAQPLSKKQILRNYNQKLKMIKQKEIEFDHLYRKQTKKYTKQQYDEFSNQNNLIHQTLMDEAHREYTNNLYKAEQEQKLDVVRKYLISNMPEEKQIKKEKERKMYIPNNLMLKKLYHCQKNTNKKQILANQQILLAGVEYGDEEHCIFLKKMIQELDIKNVITMIAPDMPYFIKTERSFSNEWILFLRNPQAAKFYLNPTPIALKDICLKKHQINLVKNSMEKSKSFLSTMNYMLQQDKYGNNFECNPLLTGLFSINVENIYFADYPIFKERQMIANSMELQKLRQLFQEHVYQFEKGKFNFSAQSLFPKHILANKINHLIGVSKAVSESSQHRSIIICPADLCELISIDWQIIDEKKQLNYSHQERDYYFNFEERNKNAPANQSFIEFIEKLVILDLMIDPIISKYFVKHESFPYLCSHTVGGKENVGKVLLVWMHFYDGYYKSLTKKRLDINGKEIQRQSRMSHLDSSLDFKSKV